MGGEELEINLRFAGGSPTGESRDPSGAGDAFAAGVIVGVLEKWEMARTLRFANAIGASACMALGCNAGVFTRPQADAFLAQG